MGKHAQQARYLVEFFDFGDVAHIPLRDGPHVVMRPCLTPLRVLAPEHLGITASQHGAHQFAAGHGFG